MAESEDHASSKRKASTEPPEDDVAGKRMKLGDEDGNATTTDGAHTETKEIGDNATPKEREHADAPAEQPPTTETHRTEPEPESRRASDARRPSATSGPPGRRSISIEEKKRGQRLFGGLVSALSRTTSGAQQQKRLEIERRQHEKAQQRRAEDEKRRAEKLERLRRTREIEQVKIDEQVMRTRHSSMLAKAHSLQTKAEPKLYYLPWQLTREQEDIISDQVRAAEERIDRERRDFRERKEQRLRALGVTPPPRSPSPPPRPPKQQPEQQPEAEPEPVPAQEREPEPELEPAPVPDSGPKEATVGEPKPPPHDANPDAAAPAPPKARNTHHDKDHEENGDEIMQDEEDVVIY